MRRAKIAISFYARFKQHLEEVIMGRYILFSRYFETNLEHKLEVGHYFIQGTNQKENSRFVKTLTSDVIESIVVEKEYLDFTSKSKASEETRQDYYSKCLDICLDLFTELIRGTLSDRQDIDFLILLQNSCFTGSYYPNHFAFLFEYGRMEFSRYGSLINQTEEKTKVFIGCFAVIRVLILRVLSSVELMYPIEFNENSLKNANLISSMIYHTFVEISKQSVPKWSAVNESALNVELGRRTEPSNSKPLASRAILQQGKSDPQDMIHGLSSKAELEMFFKDPEGFPRLRDYVNKYLDNLYLFSKKLKDRKVEIEMRRKIVEYKKLMNRVRNKMFAYSEILQRWIDQKMKQFNIQKKDIDDLSDQDRAKNDLTRQYGSYTDNQSFKSFLNQPSPGTNDWNKLKFEKKLDEDLKMINSDDGRFKSKDGRPLSSGINKVKEKTYESDDF